MESEKTPAEQRRARRKRNAISRAESAPIPIPTEPVEPVNNSIKEAPEHVDLGELLFTREIACQIVKRAWYDIKGDKEEEYVRQSDNNHREKYKRSAIHFLGSKAFETICDAVGLPADRIRTAALK